MAHQAIIFIAVLATLIANAYSEGEFSVLYSPDSIKFSEHKSLPESLLKEVYSAALGLSVEQPSEWNGLSLNDPFGTPEAIVEVYIEGLPSLENFALKRQNYPLTIDEYVPDTFSSLAHRVTQRYSQPTLVYLNLDHEAAFYSGPFGNVKIQKVSKKGLKYLRPNAVDEDLNVLQEIQMLNAITKSIEDGAITADNVPDVYFFHMKTLHSLIDLYGKDSEQAKEAYTLIANAIEGLTKAFNNAYSGEVVVAVVTSDIAHTRRLTRSLKQDAGAEVPAAETAVVEPVTVARSDHPQPAEMLKQSPATAAASTTATATPPASTTAPPTPDNAPNWNIAPKYSVDYPVIFNIMVWFNVLFWFSLIAIAYVLIDMDPGRDSIIYRMTSNRIKKDN